MNNYEMGYWSAIKVAGLMTKEAATRAQKLLNAGELSEGAAKYLSGSGYIAHSANKAPPGYNKWMDDTRGGMYTPSLYRQRAGNEYLRDTDHTRRAMITGEKGRAGHGPVAEGYYSPDPFYDAATDHPMISRVGHTMVGPTPGSLPGTEPVDLISLANQRDKAYKDLLGLRGRSSLEDGNWIDDGVRNS